MSYRVIHLLLLLCNTGVHAIATRLSTCTGILDKYLLQYGQRRIFNIRNMGQYDHLQLSLSASESVKMKTEINEFAH